VSDRARRVLPAAVWTAAVLLASGPGFSASESGFLLRAILRVLVGEVSPVTYEVLHVALRKAAHVTEYAILGALWFRALRTGDTPSWRTSWALGAFGVAALVSLADEARQSLTASRTGSLHDVALDLAGAALALVAIRAWSARGPTIS